MASQSLTGNPSGRTHTKQITPHDGAARFTFAIVIAGMNGVLWSCTPPATKMPSMDIPSPSHTATSQLTPTPSQSATPTVSPTVTFTPTSTPTPFGTPISIIPWPEEGSLLQPVDIQVNFGTSLDDLPSGPYLLYKDQETRGLDYSSFDGSIQGSLFAFEPPYSVSAFSRGDITARIVGVFELNTSTRYVIDMKSQRVLKLGPLCKGLIGFPSPNGQWMAVGCQTSGDRPEGKIIIELISLEDGSASHMEIPTRIEELRFYNYIYVQWVTDDSFIFYIIGSKEGPCIVSIPDLGMRCPPELQDEEHPFIAVSKNWFIVKGRSQAWIVDIFPISCFYEPGKCKPVVTLDDPKISFARFRWSPDETMLAIDSGDQRTSTTSEIGYYDTETWTYHKIRVFSRDYGLFGWCPDSSCMLIVGEPDYLAYLDGRIERLPFNLRHPQSIIGVP